MQNRKNQLLLFIKILVFFNSDIAVKYLPIYIFSLWFKSVIVYFIDRKRLLVSSIMLSYFYISVCISATPEESCFFVTKAKKGQFPY